MVGLGGEMNRDCRDDIDHGILEGEKSWKVHESSSLVTIGLISGNLWVGWDDSAAYTFLSI